MALTNWPFVKKENTCWEKPRSENGWKHNKRSVCTDRSTEHSGDAKWDADTAVMKSFSKDNDGYAYFIVAIDVFSRFAHTFPLRSTRGNEMSSALQTLFRRRKKPIKLRTDKGVEFRNREVQRLLKAESESLLHAERTEELLPRNMHQDGEVQTLPLPIPSSSSSPGSIFSTRSPRATTEVIIVPSRWLPER